MERRGYRASPFVSGNSLATESTFQGFPTLAAQYVMEMSTQQLLFLGKVRGICSLSAFGLVLLRTENERDLVV